MIDQELCWMAGFFDGEGCIQLQMVQSWSSTVPIPKLRVSVSNTDPTACDLFVKRFAGTRVRSTKPLKAHYKQVYRWDVIGQKAYEFLCQVKPLVVVKKEQLELACEFWELPWRNGKRVLRTPEQQAIDTSLANRVRLLKKATING